MTAFTTEEWSRTLLFNLKNADYGFAARIVNHNFHNPGGTKADAVKVMRPLLTPIGTSTSNDYAMPTTFGDASSETLTINLNTPLKYAIGIPWEVQLKTEHDVIAGYRMAAEDMLVRLRGAAVNAAIAADATIPVVSGTQAAPTYVTKDTILDILSKGYVQLMKTGAILEFGKYRFVDTEEKENTAELALDATPMESDGEQPAGILGNQVKTALPVCGCPADIYELIINAATQAGELTQTREFYGHVPVIRGFEIVMDESLNHMSDTTNKHSAIYMGTRNLVTEAMTDSRSEVIPDQDKYRDLLRGYIVYGCAVVQPNCGVKAFVTTTPPSNEP